MAQTANRELRERFAVKYRRFLNDLTTLLGRDDRIGMPLDWNPDEYDIEAGAILEKLWRCRAEEDVAPLACAVYEDKFGPVGARSPDDFAALGREIWGLWQECLRADAAAWGLLEAEAAKNGNSHCVATTVACPKCKTKAEGFTWSCVNGTDDPSLREDLLEGRLNVLKCAACGEESPLGDDLVYVDTRRGYCVLYCSLWQAGIEDPRWRDATFKGSFTRDAKCNKSGALARVSESSPPCMADPHLVFDLGEMRRYVRFRERLFELYERLGDELFPPDKRPEAPRGGGGRLPR